MSNDLDFSAWEAPPPPDGIADAVLARMGGTAVGLEVPSQEPPRRRRWVIAASAVVVLVAAGGIWAIVRHREPAAPNAGQIAADRAQHLDLGGVTADLDRGADIRWHRTRSGLDIEQRAGAASWRVWGDQHVVIGAMVASIDVSGDVSGDAAGASLRVEVPMNMSDARVIGASAITAGAVAMVTVVVYEGHVKVASSGQTVVVQPGTTYTVPLPHPDPQPVVGVAPATVPGGKQKVAVLGLEGWNGDGVPRELVEDLRDRLKVGTGAFVLAPASDRELVDEKVLHDCESEQPACIAAIGSDLGADVVIYGSIKSQRVGYELVLKRFDVHAEQLARTVTDLIPAGESRGASLAGRAKALAARLLDDTPLPDSPDDAIVQQVLAGSADELRACLANDIASATLHVTIGPAGKATSTRIDSNDAPPCISHVIDHLAFPLSKHGGTATRQLARAPCDVDALIAEGNSAMTVRGDAEAALAKYEAALACKPQERTEKLAFMAACNASDVAKARSHWAKLPVPSRETLLQMCVRNGIGREQLDPSVCDVDALTQQGIDAEASGQHAAALGKFEQAIRCKPSDRLYQLSFMASCRAKMIASARRYWSKLDDATKPRLQQMCQRVGITPDTLDGGAPQTALADGMGGLRVDGVPPAKILIDGKAVGMTPVITTLPPGKHKVTYVIGDDRFTYVVTIKAGVTETLSKDLQ